MKEYTNLHELRDALHRSIPDPDKRRLVGIRLMLRTGININEPSPRHVDSPVSVSRVLEVIEALGLEL